MKTIKTKTLLFTFAALIFSIFSVFSQSKLIPEDLKLRLFNAKNSGNVELAKQLNKELETYLIKSETSTDLPSNYRVIEPNLNPGETDWYNNEVLVSGKNIGDKNYRQIDIKQGQDGNIYAASITRESGSFEYGIQCLKSTNGGINWTALGGFSTTDKIFSISLLVESRNNANPDSTRFWIYYTISSNSNGNDAKLRVYSRRSNANSVIDFIAGTPGAGNKFEFVSACSDGEFWEELTYMHIIVTEVTNANNTVGLRHFRTANWGSSFSNALFNSGFMDTYPSAAFLRGGADSIFVAVERKISSNESQLKVYSTHNVPSGIFLTRSLGTSGANIKYEKPVITCSQRNANNINTFMVTCTKNEFPLWFHSTNSGSVWSSEQVIFSNRKMKYVHCASDSLAAGDNNFVITCLTTGGDSVLVYQGKPGAMSQMSLKINSQFSTNFISPACVVYKNGNTKSAGILYPGISGANLFFNGSHMFTGIQNINSNIPSGFILSQNYPNPFNPLTNIEFSIPKAGFVKLTVFDITGKQVDKQINSQMNPGTYRVEFSAGNLSSGIYFYTLEGEGFRETKKMMLIK